MYIYIFIYIRKLRYIYIYDHTHFFTTADFTICGRRPKARSRGGSIQDILETLHVLKTVVDCQMLKSWASSQDGPRR